MDNSTRTKPCPVCEANMVIKAYANEYFSIYCRQCGYGLREAFATRATAIKRWNAAALFNDSISH